MIDQSLTLIPIDREAYHTNPRFDMQTVKLAGGYDFDKWFEPTGVNDHTAYDKPLSGWYAKYTSNIDTVVRIAGVIVFAYALEFFIQ